jgi:hypothetical protein
MYRTNEMVAGTAYSYSAITENSILRDVAEHPNGVLGESEVDDDTGQTSLRTAEQR